jgi:small subunit ribosomal protein S7
MSRRSSNKKRPVPPDPIYNSRLLSMTIRRIMRSGKQSLAARIIYDAMEIIGERTGNAPIEVFEQAIKNLTPLVKSKLVELVVLPIKSRWKLDRVEEPL